MSKNILLNVKVKVYNNKISGMLSINILILITITTYHPFTANVSSVAASGEVKRNFDFQTEMIVSLVIAETNN